MDKGIYLFSLSNVVNDDIIHINSLHVKPVKTEIDFNGYDYLIITSKQAVATLEELHPTWKTKSVLAVFGATAKSVIDAGGNLLEIGSGYGDDLKDIICSYPKTIRWLYVRAKEVASGFVSKCVEDGFSIDEKIIYETSCSNEILDVAISDDATLVFTSPSSVKCFLKTHDIAASNRVVVIGQTTARSLPLHVNYLVADEPSIMSCIKKAKGE